MEIVVVLIVVKFGFFLVITRDHGSFWGRHQVEIFPTGPPELFNPARGILEHTKTTRTTRTTTTRTTKTPRLLNFERRNYVERFRVQKFLDISEAFPGNYLDISRSIPGHFP